MARASRSLSLAWRKVCTLIVVCILARTCFVSLYGSGLGSRAFSQCSSQQTPSRHGGCPEHSRRGVLLAGGLGMWGVSTASAMASEKLRNLPVEKLVEIVREDLTQRQFLATADFTRAIYDESCTFTDEIDTYPLDKFIKGTQALFVGAESEVRLQGDVAPIDGGRAVQFRFDETLAFNFGPVHPKVRLSGVCTLTRGADGLITSYKEKWDQSIPEVLSTARL